MIALLAQGSGPVIPDFGGGGASSCVRQDKLFCMGWFKDNWGDTLQPALVHHVVLVAVSVAIGFVIALGLALLSYRWWRFEAPVTYFTNFLYTIPSLAFFQIMVAFTGLGDTTAEIALVSYTLSVLFFNILAGLRGVSPEVRDAAEGMGLTARQTLLRVELPLALPAIIAGLRIAAVNIVSLATIAAYIGVQSLGRPIFDAIQRDVFKTEIIAAGLLAIALALVIDAVLVLTQRVLTPWARRYT